MTRHTEGDRFVLAVDLGTTGLKVGLVSLTGEHRVDGRRRADTQLLPGGGAEQDADEWWRLVSRRGARRHRERRGRGRSRSSRSATTGQWASTVPVDDERSTRRTVHPLDGHARRAAHPAAHRRQGRRATRRRAIATWVRRTGGAPSTSGADPIGHMLHLDIDRPRSPRRRAGTSNRSTTCRCDSPAKRSPHRRR